MRKAKIEDQAERKHFQIVASDFPTISVDSEWKMKVVMVRLVSVVRSFKKLNLTSELGI